MTALVALEVAETRSEWIRIMVSLYLGPSSSSGVVQRALPPLIGTEIL